jgi:hypothetical protein
MKRWAAWTLALVLATPAAGCTWRGTKQDFRDTKNSLLGTDPTTRRLYEEDDSSIIELNYKAADKLHATLRGSLPAGSPISVERFANDADPSDKAPFGRVVAGQVAARLAQTGHRISAKAPAPAGRQVVSQNATAVEEKKTPPRPSVLAGSYVLAGDVILVHARVVTVDDDTELAAYDWTLPVNKSTRELLPQLKQGGFTPSVKNAF